MAKEREMTANERELLEKMTALFPKLTEPEKERTIAFIEGMAFKAALSATRQAAPTG